MANSYLFGGNTRETPESVRRKRQLAMAIMGTAAPKNIGEGLNALGSGIVAGIMNRRADRAEDEGRSAARAAYDGALGGMPDRQVSNASASAAAPSNSSHYRDAIASLESAGGGDYTAIGPMHPKLGRPLGRYQIMEANIGPWSREALGREVTPEEFLSSPEIQDAIFDHKFNAYVQEFGPEGAAQAWFAGPGGVGKTSRKDALGTDVGTYGRKFMNVLGPRGEPTEAGRAEPPAGMPPPPPASHSPFVPSFPGKEADDRIAAPSLTPPNARPPEQAIPAQFQGSRQLANAQGGIMPALMDGTPASPEQVAQAQAIGRRQQAQAQAADLMPLLEAMGNPWLSPEERAVLHRLYEQQVQSAEARRNPRWE